MTHLDHETQGIKFSTCTLYSWYAQFPVYGKHALNERLLGALVYIGKYGNTFGYLSCCNNYKYQQNTGQAA